MLAIIKFLDSSLIVDQHSQIPLTLKLIIMKNLTYEELYLSLIKLKLANQAWLYTYLYN